MLTSKKLRNSRIIRDLERMYAAFLDGPETTPARRAAFVLLNSEFHCVAAYRLGQFTQRMRARAPAAAVPVLAVHRIWNRWVTHVHHCEISAGARVGPGLLLMHRTGVMIGPVRMGANVVVHQNVTIGQRVASGDQGVPTIGDAVWIGPAATIVGAITVGDGATISAGTVLTRDVPARALVAGVPGRVVARDYDNSAMLGLARP